MKIPVRAKRIIKALSKQPFHSIQFDSYGEICLWDHILNHSMRKNEFLSPFKEKIYRYELTLNTLGIKPFILHKGRKEKFGTERRITKGYI